MPGDLFSLSPDHEPRTASEIGEGPRLVRRATGSKLQTPAERGDLEWKKVGGRAVVFWRPDERPELSDDWL